MTLSRDQRIDVALASCVGAASLLVYLHTLAPGLIATGDTPKMQYVGRVLGVPHPPGYPLYTCLTHLATWLPVGSVAYRANLFSAFCAALTAILGYACSRGLDSSRSAAASAAFGLAFGPVLWSQAVVAEVYTLATALFGAVLLGLILWRRTRKARWLGLAVASTALSLGHHLTIVTVMPAAALFALLVSPRFVLGWRTLAATCIAGLAGLAQYYYVILRTRQNAFGLDCAARNLGELLAVVRAERFSGHLFSFSIGDVLTERVTYVVSILATELGVGVLPVIAGGWYLIARRDYRSAVLLLGSVAGPCVFALNYDVGDLPVFLCLAYFSLGIVAALGLSALRRLHLLMWLLVAVYPGTQLLRSWSVNDLSQQTTVIRYADALVDYLPRPCTVVTVDYDARHVLLYKILVDDEQGITVVDSLEHDRICPGASDPPVFVLGRETHRDWMLPCAREPVSLPVMRMDELLALRKGDLVILTATGHLVEMRGDLVNLAHALGVHVARWPNDGIVAAVVGSPEGQVRTGSLDSGPTPLYRETNKRPLSVRTTPHLATITLGGRRIARARRGALLAFIRNGRVTRRYALSSLDWIPYGNHILPLSRVTPREHSSR